MVNDNKPIEEPIDESTTENGKTAEEEVAESKEGENEIEHLRQELEAARKKADENWEVALRAKAEADNVRKRAAKDVENAHKYSIEKLVSEFLPVKDSLELGLSASENATVESLVEGMELTLKAFNNALEKCGVEEVDPLGEKFDPELHQAMSMIEKPGVEPGTVVEVMQKGYLLNGRLVRPAMVVVAK